MLDVPPAIARIKEEIIPLFRWFNEVKTTQEHPLYGNQIQLENSEEATVPLEVSYEYCKALANLVMGNPRSLNTLVITVANTAQKHVETESGSWGEMPAWFPKGDPEWKVDRTSNVAFGFHCTRSFFEYDIFEGRITHPAVEIRLTAVALDAQDRIAYFVEKAHSAETLDTIFDIFELSL